MRRTSLSLLLPSLLAVGCTAGTTAAAVPVGDADVAVVATDLRFDPGRIEVQAGRATTIHLANDGGIVHDLVMASGWESGVVNPGEAVTVTLESLTETTVAWCSIPGHRAAGMELELIVVEEAG